MVSFYDRARRSVRGGEGIFRSVVLGATYHRIRSVHEKNGIRLLSYTGPRPNRTRGLVRHAIMLLASSVPTVFPRENPFKSAFLCISFEKNVHFVPSFWDTPAMRLPRKPNQKHNRPVTL